jgi:dienelactone hydrolase
MTWFLKSGIITLVLCTAISAAAQDSSTKQLAARTEVHSIDTLTISDRQFLRGDENGKHVTVSGELRIAQGVGPLPVVVMLHGSGGITANVDMWAREFAQLGVSSFIIDSFTGRALTDVNATQAALGRLNMILDAYRALGILANHPRVPADRIVLMGFSRGGQSALYASLTRFHQAWNKSGLEFAAYVPFYPDCATTYVSDSDVVERPIRIFHGTPDDYNPIASCKAYVERLRAAGHDVQLTEYPNAQHVFDMPTLPQTPVAVKDGQTVRHCVIREEPLGLLINAATKEAFTYSDPCVERDPHVAYDPAALEASKQSVKTLLRAAVKLNIN